MLIFYYGAHFVKSEEHENMSAVCRERDRGTHVLRCKMIIYKKTKSCSNFEVLNYLSWRDTDVSLKT